MQPVWANVSSYARYPDREADKVIESKEQQTPKKPVMRYTDRQADKVIESEEQQKPKKPVM
jgi:hypothetical protein